MQLKSSFNSENFLSPPLLVLSDYLTIELDSSYGGMTILRDDHECAVTIREKAVQDRIPTPDESSVSISRVEQNLASLKFSFLDLEEPFLDDPNSDRSWHCTLDCHHCVGEDQMFKVISFSNEITTYIILFRQGRDLLCSTKRARSIVH